jgi:hypothetical protein
MGSNLDFYTDLFLLHIKTKNAESQKMHLPLKCFFFFFFLWKCVKVLHLLTLALKQKHKIKSVKKAFVITKHPLKEIYNWNNGSYYFLTWRFKICSNTYTQYNRACKQIIGQARSGLDILDQRFSTWGTRTPGGTPSTQRGYASSWLADCIKFRSSQLCFTPTPPTPPPTKN